MSINLRLSDELAGALRAEAARRGRSLQEIVREAIVKELGLDAGLTAMQRAVRAGIVDAAEPFRDFKPMLTLPPDISSLDLLEPDDRLVRQHQCVAEAGLRRSRVKCGRFAVGVKTPSGSYAQGGPVEIGPRVTIPHRAVGRATDSVSSCTVG